jgi:hypothetical protein
MKELVLLLAIAVYAFTLGRRVLGFFRVEFASRAGCVAASTALGLGLIAYVVFVVGLFECLNVSTVMAAGIGVLGAVYLPWPFACKVATSLRERNAGFSPDSGCVQHARDRSSLVERDGVVQRVLVQTIQVAAVAVALVGTLISALAPPTAGDALCYHLEIPKRFVQLGEITYLPLTDNSLFPFLMEMLYTLGLLIGSPILAQLLHWLVGVLFALAVVELASPILGARASGWAAIVALLVPGVTNQMTAPLNDLAVALYSTLMVTAWTRWTGTLQSRWLVLAGVFGGFGMSVKLVTGAMVVVLMVATVVRVWRRDGLATAWRSAAALAGCIVLTGGIWYARSWYHLGNPVYPYFNTLFGLEPHTESTLIATRNPFTVAWLATMHPEIFGGRGVQFGAVFLALLPGLALLPRRLPELNRLLVIAAGFGAVWFALRQDLRFLLPVVPILAVASIAVACALKPNRWAFWATSGCIAALLAFQTLIVVKRANRCIAVALGRESRDEYLRRHEPSFVVAEFVNARLRSDCRVISQDFRGFYFEPDFVREAALGRYSPYDERGMELAESLAVTGFTHVLLVESHNPESAIYDQGFVDRLGPAVECLPLVLASHFESPLGDRRDYRLLELPAAGNRSSNAARTKVSRGLRAIAN